MGWGPTAAGLRVRALQCMPRLVNVLDHTICMVWGRSPRKHPTVKAH